MDPQVLTMMHFRKGRWTGCKRSSWHARSLLCDLYLEVDTAASQALSGLIQRRAKDHTSTISRGNGFLARLEASKEMVGDDENMS